MGWFKNERLDRIEKNLEYLAKRMESRDESISGIKEKDIEGEMSSLIERIHALAAHMGVEFDVVQVENPMFEKPRPVMMDKIICKKKPKVKK